ncbi:alpha/beta hydrolase [Jeongeupia naejangsanensis]|uniref:Alpha/beta fold hydrolase n=1 Tax=Jeongeupia naejangsanensis TaxID=613195 RepID=A0ABS2BHM0_9NEIS|nr:alpha/beta fold hydrolase [Jeongeupia naejangsanensis]MBM3115117.1 alpha/beta fold hydrolase [Jeongeupia naejangsanensis]
MRQPACSSVLPPPRRSAFAAPSDGSVAILLVHGLGGTDRDLGSLGKVLQRAGITTHTLTLPGHGGRPEDLYDVQAEDWIATVVAHYRALSVRYETLHLMGMCLGALLAIETAKRVDLRNGRLVALAPPVFIDGWAMPWYRELRHVVYHVPGLMQLMRIPEAEPYGIKNEPMRALVKAKLCDGNTFHYPWVPLSCIREVDRVRRWVRSELNRVRAATLIVHAREDELTSPRSAALLKRRIPHSRAVIVENSYHMICVDNDRKQVATEVLSHLGLGHAAQSSSCTAL